ncbi:MAG: LPP20 family lipoprotein [Candidatus Marinimicrobia bacterium]|nr:LPP20 family lipoprotein [Candidatus Neomarinimicrobiota bacterium]
MKIQIIRIGWIIFITSSMMFAQVPDWAKTSSHKKYPPAKYFLGVGISEDKTEAAELARADVAKQIQVKIESELETIESEFREGDKSYISSEVKSRTKSAASETIAGMEIVETKEVKGKNYALAVLNKQKYLSGLEVQMDETLMKTGQLVETGRKSIADGKMFVAIENFTDAQNTIPEFYTKSALYTALTGSQYPNIDQFTGPGILAELRDVLSRIELRIVSGNDQKSKAGNPLPEPIKVRVIYKTSDNREIGVDRFPIAAKFENGESIGKAETNSDGFAVFSTVATPTDNLGRSGAVQVYLNLLKIPETYRPAIGKSQVTIRFDIIVADLKFAVKVSDNLGKRLEFVEKDVSNLVVENGYVVTEDAGFVIQGIATVGNKKEIESPSGKQFFVESNLTLNLVEKSTGNVLATTDGSGKGLDVGSLIIATEKSFKNIKVSKKKFAAFLQGAVR